MPMSIILPVLAQILNRYLKLDPEMQMRLGEFNGRVLRATITTFDWDFYIKIHENHLELTDTNPGLIDAAFKAGITALTAAAFSEKAGITEGVELHGDTAMIQTIITLFKNVEIDWEECLATYTGDAIAHGLGNIARNLKSLHSQLFTTSKLNIKEYLQEEINLLAAPFAIEDFCNDVDAFRDAVERCAAKITIMENYELSQ